MFIDSTTRALAALAIDPLTSADKEDWTIIPDGERVHMVAYRELDGTAVIAHGEPMPIGEFRKTIRTLPAKHNLGVVMVIMCSDRQKRRSVELLTWLTKMASKKNFSVTSICGTATTEEAVASMASRLRQVEQ